MASPILMKIFVYGLALFYGWLVLISFFIRWIRRPSGRFWRVKRRDVPPACLSDPAYGQHSYVQLKDVKLHYVEKGDQSKPLMLFVHGFPEFWYSWRHQIKEFSKDYWTVAIDLRGYGDSDKPKGTAPYDISILTDDLQQVVKALGREKFTLVAHDWGGVIAWHFLFTYSEMVERYIIMDAPYPPLYAKMARKNLKQFLMSWYTFFFQLPVLPELFISSYDFAGFAIIKIKDGANAKDSAITDEDLEAYKYTFGKPGALTPPINYYRCNLWRGRDQSKNKRVKPSDESLPHGLLIFGEKDKYLHSDFVRLTKENVCNLQTDVIPNGNHFVQQDEPVAVNLSMRKFLAQ